MGIYYMYCLKRRSVIFVVNRDPTQILVKYILRFKSTRERLEYYFLTTKTNNQNENNKEPPDKVALLCTIDGDYMICLPLNINQNISNIRRYIEIAYDHVPRITYQIKHISKHTQK